MPSPSKRKRTPSAPPCIDTVPLLLARDRERERGRDRDRDRVERDSESPRTRVADDLGRLAVGDDDPRHVLKKRITDTPPRGEAVEIQETPGAYDVVPRRALSPPAASPGPPHLAQHHRFKLHPPSRVTAPPPPTPVASPLGEPDRPLALSTAVSIAQDKLSTLRCDSPSSTDASPAISPLPAEPGTPNAASESLTWKDSEITGHEIDAAADDDGEGINGIGFLPTPAIATKRQEWRRRQITDWRARETREARQRRYEKRKTSQRESHLSCSDGDPKRRAVRFA